MFPKVVHDIILLNLSDDVFLMHMDGTLFTRPYVYGSLKYKDVTDDSNEKSIKRSL